MSEGSTTAEAAARTGPSPRNGPSPRRSFVPWQDPASEPLIRFDRVRKSYGGVVAVDDLSLDVFPREFFALLGPSGCGKTTLMRLLAGFETPSAGDIILGGESVVEVPPHQRPINMMFQSYALFPHLSVWDNIAFGLRRDRLPRAEVRRRVEEMLALVQLTAQARRRPDQLSGGQRQRVALARSLAKRPSVLLLDEPLAALDKKLRGETQFELMNLQEEIGITFLIVTHDQEEAMVLADRIAIMRDGKIEQVAAPEDIYESPASRYVADFVGDVNLVEGVVSGLDETSVTLSCPAASGPIVLPRRGGETHGVTAFAAVRPEKMTLERVGETSPGENAFVGEVFDIAYMGDYTLYRIRTDDGVPVAASRLNRRRVDPDPITWHDRVVMRFERGDAVFLDR